MFYVFRKIGALIVLCFFVAGVFLFNFGSNAYATTVEEEIAKKNQQIEELQRQIAEYEQKILLKQGETKTLQNEIKKFDAQISQVQLEIRSLNISIETTSLEIDRTQDRIEETVKKIDSLRIALADFVRITNEIDQESILASLLKNGSLSEFFLKKDQISSLQGRAKLTIDDLQASQEELEQKEFELENQKSEQESLKRLQEVAKSSLASKKTQKSTLLKTTQGQEAQYQKLIKSSKQDIENIKGQVQYLIKYGLATEDILKYGQLAALRVGIRPAFLIAILEIESGLGKNVGTGNWMDDMYQCYLKLGKKTRAEAEKNAFMEIVNKLGLDPYSVKVSAEPYYGCGGAMGPAQFIPTTWMAYEDRVAAITGHNPPNPWNIEDAFTASAIKLAAGGATSQNKTGETKAAKAYLSGSSTCSRAVCISYANSVLRKAAEIEERLQGL